MFRIDPHPNQGCRAPATETPKTIKKYYTLIYGPLLSQIGPASFVFEVIRQ